MLNIVNNEPLTTLNYVNHLERGYCANHPDVIANTKQQVVDRAVKQLLTLLQGMKFDVGEDDDGIVLNLGYTPQGGPSGLIRVEKETGWLQYYSPDFEDWYYFDNMASYAEHETNTAIHNDYGNNAVTIITTDTILTPTQVMTNRMIICTAACTVTLPSCFSGARVTIWAENCTINIQAAEDEQSGATIKLPAEASGVYEITVDPAAYGNNIVLRAHAESDTWWTESQIGSWEESV